MSQQEQWRFQWPDGTWIRWNPQTQAWEKEVADGDADAPVAAAPPREVIERPEPEPLIERPEPQPVIERPEPEPVAEEEPESIANAQPEMEPVPELRSDPEFIESRGGRRSMVGDVLPPGGEDDIPGPSLWPTVLTGMVVGLGVGLYIWNVIR